MLRIVPHQAADARPIFHEIGCSGHDHSGRNGVKTQRRVCPRGGIGLFRSLFEIRGLSRVSRSSFRP
jgi:hypothetical protein